LIEKDKDYRYSWLKKSGMNSLSYLTISKNLKSYKGDWGGYIGYKQLFKCAVILGDPIVQKKDLHEAIRDFKKNCISKNVHICIFLNTDYSKEVLIKEGFRGLFVGQEAIVDLNKFSISGKEGWSIRSSINYAKRNKMIVEEYNQKENKCSFTEKELHRITKEWCQVRKMNELTFAFGHVDFENLDSGRYFICKHKGRIVGFITYFPIYGLNSYYLDLSRREINAPRGTIDYLIVKSFEVLKNEGIKKVYIGYSPAANSQNSLNNQNFITNFFILFRPWLNIFYPFKSEFFFKKKYATEWQDNYFYYYPKISIRMLFALLHSIYTGGIATIIFNKIRYFPKNKIQRE
jgi:phosphatidylglycerol lysyltransferase